MVSEPIHLKDRVDQQGTAFYMTATITQQQLAAIYFA